MSVLFVLVIVSILVASGFLLAFVWSVRSGQFEDNYTPSVRMLLDDEPAEINSEDSQTNTRIK